MRKLSSKIDKNSICAVVGGCGFLGSHLVDYLITQKEVRKVVVIDNLATGKLSFLPQNCKDKIRFYHHDITQSESRLADIFSGERVCFVFNYAAYPYIPVSFERPLHVFMTNAVGAMHVINAAQETDAITLQVSSAEIYGDSGNRIHESNNLDQSISETDTINPCSTYGVSKLAVDQYIASRWDEKTVFCIALRQFNCIGERETHPYVVPEIISQVMSEKYDGNIYLGNNSVRDFMYAGDAVRLAVEIIEKGDFGQAYNLGSEEGIRIYDLARHIAGLCGKGEPNIIYELSRARPREIWYLRSNNSKTKKAIGDFGPMTSLDQALCKTIDWYVSNGKKWPWQTL